MSRPTFRVDVRKLRKGPLLEIVIELIGMYKFVHGIILDILVHPRIENVSFVVVFPTADGGYLSVLVSG